MRLMLLRLVVCVLTLLQAAYADTEGASKKQLVSEHLVLTGNTAEHVREAYLKEMSALFEKEKDTSTLDSDYKNKIQIIMKEEAKKLLDEKLSDDSDLLDILYPIYDESLTDEEIKMLINMDSDYTVRSILDKLPVVAEGFYQYGEKEGKRIDSVSRERIIDRMKKEGFIIE